MDSGRTVGDVGTAEGASELGEGSSSSLPGWQPWHASCTPTTTATVRVFHPRRRRSSAAAVTWVDPGKQSDPSSLAARIIPTTTMTPLRRSFPPCPQRPLRLLPSALWDSFHRHHYKIYSTCTHFKNITYCSFVYDTMIHSWWIVLVFIMSAVQ